MKYLCPFRPVLSQQHQVPGDYEQLCVSPIGAFVPCLHLRWLAIFGCLGLTDISIWQAGTSSRGCPQRSAIG